MDKLLGQKVRKLVKLKILINKLSREGSYFSNYNALLLEKGMISRYMMGNDTNCASVI